MMIYAGFWRRTAALLVEALIWVPISLTIHYHVAWRSIPVAIASYVVLGVVSFVYRITFLVRWGQTIGKMVARIRVTRIDGQPIGWGVAVLRTSVDMILWAISTTAFVYVLLSWDGPQWSSLDALERSKLIIERNPLHLFSKVASLVWMGSELVVFLSNKKRRALHDFIAGTVVVHTARFPTLERLRRAKNMEQPKGWPEQLTDAIRPAKRRQEEQ